MQHRTLRRVVLSFAVVIVAVGSLTLLSCGGGGGQTLPINSNIPLNATNAATTAVLNGKTFTVSGNELAADTTAPALKAALAGQSPALTFANVSGANGNVTLTNPTASGTVRFASCTFTITAPANLVGTIFVQNCSVTIAGTADLGGAAQTGTITLTLNGTTSAPVTTQVQLTDTGVLIVDGVTTTTTVTGTSGG